VKVVHRYHVRLGQTGRVMWTFPRMRVRSGGAVAVGVSLVIAGVGMVLGGSGAGAVTPDSSALVPLVGTTAAIPAGAQVLGPAVSDLRLTVDVVLRPRDPGALDAFIRSVSTPGSPQYRHYLGAGQFASDFGPTPATVAATRQWLAATGLVVGRTTQDGLLTPVSGTTSQMESVFAVSLVRARLTSGRVTRLTTRDPVVPASLSASLAGVVGLSDQSQPTPSIVKHTLLTRLASGSSAIANHGEVGPQPCGAIASAPNLWTADKLASTYGLTSLYGQGRNGAGQTVGIYELEPYTPSDVQAYQSCYGLHVAVHNVSVDGGSSSAQSGEAALDIEVVAGLAPGAAISVYTGPNDNATGPIDTLNRMVVDDTAKVLSISWGQCETMLSPSETSAESTIFAQAAAQGQSVLAASGDSGSSDCYSALNNPTATQLAVDDPAVQPDVTGVGGTSLSNAAPGAPSESVWNANGGAGGGGNSSRTVAPSYQKVAAAQSIATSYACGANHTQQCRQVPDVAASADPNFGDAVFFRGLWILVGGTSVAAPLWSAAVALTNQGCAVPAGRLNDALYGSGAAAAVNDIISGTNSLFQRLNYSARSGYDLASGWGSPRAVGLLGLLSGSPAGCPTVTGLSTSSGPAVGGTTVTITGSGFGTGTPVVHFGGATAQVTSSTPTSVTVITPNVTVGGTAVVTLSTTGTAGGTSPAQAASLFTFLSPQVSSVVSNHGPLGGGGRVTINGSDFTVGDSVTFGGSPASGVQLVSSSSLTVVVPAGTQTSAPVSVVVVGSTGTSPPSSGGNYYYALPGYLMVASDGGVFAFGHAGFFGSAGNLSLSAPVVGSALTPTAQGYWMVGASGQIFPFGDAAYFGSGAQLALAHPMVGMAATPDGQGYWLVASDGGIFAYGDAGFYGSTGNIVLNRPIVGMAATPDGQGYWLVASDGGIFAYGDARFVGSTGSLTLNKPVVGMAATRDGQGYWLVASDGGLFAYGDARFAGSTGALTLNKPVVGMSVDLTGDGYWLVASDGGIFAFGTAPFFGSTGNIVLNRPITGTAAA
jgi:hypothetical protein